jgi:hypothetical protein
MNQEVSWHAEQLRTASYTIALGSYIIIIIIIIKYKVKVTSLCLTKQHTTKAYWGVEVELHAFLTSALDGGEGQLHAPAALPAGREPLLPIG